MGPVRDSQVAEENEARLNPKVLPLGFLFGGQKMREPRVYLQGAVYYTTVKAGAGELLFRDDADYVYFLELIRERKIKYNFKLYCFCLLPQHYHLLIETSDKNISKIMQALNTSYGLYYNNKYKRQGHLLAGRFQMRAVDKEATLLELTYHMHLNPLRLGLVKAAEEYCFSSYLEYTKDADLSFLVDYDEVLAYLGPLEDKLALRTKYREHIQEFAQEEKGDGSIFFNRKPSKNRTVPLVVGSALLVVMGLVLVLRTGSFKEVARPTTLNRELSMQKKNLLSLPEGLPPIENNQSQEKQVWEFWRN